MHIHILGICGTFMGGIAAIAKSDGHRVTGSDQAIYPPMNEQLQKLGIEIIEGFDLHQLKLKPDLIVIGNIMSRGMPIIEEILNNSIPFISGPAWLSNYVLKDRHVIAIAGTHGKTTTASLAAWILEDAGLDPGFLIGGVPTNFDTTARLGSGKFFVIEADEYDTSFFDKRAKFIHYNPQTLVINNLEFDHADIYKDMDAILWQFHQLLRFLPSNAQIVSNGSSEEIEIKRLFAMGCWTPILSYSSDESDNVDWKISSNENLSIDFFSEKKKYKGSKFNLLGTHNLENAAAAILAAKSIGIDIQSSLNSLVKFNGVKRRLELIGSSGGVELYDDFAHHPTAVRRTLLTLKSISKGRIIAVIEPRSNTMKMGTHQGELIDAIKLTDLCWLFKPPELVWDPADYLSENFRVVISEDTESIVKDVVDNAKPEDKIVIMSNGSFDGIHQSILNALRSNEK
ncbi:MAG: UDP-N-acetylmuramate:L-alanyl-gamma-D-glutamyl-meso-diaminopimelate ligase [Pseudomonadota bacterium]|nr:UDP-N-acetylmuramate:L-alanyl-gamma-D-glutamyl-meso-diaminopimelate ligase [Pseudomonadota bacterium]